MTPNPRENDCIDASREEEVAYWSRALGVDEQKLRNAVKTVGPKIADVRRHIEEHQARR
jgi:hypothetical protein